MHSSGCAGSSEQKGALQSSLLPKRSPVSLRRRARSQPCCANFAPAQHLPSSRECGTPAVPHYKWKEAGD
eukprot:1160307-Pelagomonas_calceolata.AAC.3